MYMSLEDPHRPPIVAKSSFDAGKRSMEQEVAELKELLRVSANLYLWGQMSVDPIDSDEKRNALREAGLTLERINAVLLER